MACACQSPPPSSPQQPAIIVTSAPVASCAGRSDSGIVVTPGSPTLPPQTTLPLGYAELVARVTNLESANALLQSQVQTLGLQLSELQDRFDSCVTCPEPTS